MKGAADRLAGVRNVLTALSLSEEDLEGFGFAAKFSALQAEINALTLAVGHSENWLIEWLAKEQATGGVLYAAAKINKNRNGSLDTSPSDPRSRTTILRLFNDWVSEFLARADVYEDSSHRPDVVAGWIAGTQAIPRTLPTTRTSNRVPSPANST